MSGWQVAWTSERSIWASKPDGKIDPSVHSQLAVYISSHRNRSIRTATPASGGVLVEFDVLHADFDASDSTIMTMIQSFESLMNPVVVDEVYNGRKISIGVCYDDRVAPDLMRIAGELSCHTERIVELHTRVTYRVVAVGFLPGFGYLESLDSSLRLPRRNIPRTRVPAGSVAIAENMTAVYPQQSAGGWHLIGRTPERLFDPTRQEPAVLRVGDSVQFEQLTFDEYNARGCAQLRPVF